MTLSAIQKNVIACRKCPRLVKYIAGIREKYPSYWCKPVPGFGDENARIMLLGLAPGRFGSNRTGRMFTGDASGKFLFKALHTMGWCNKSEAAGVDDGLKLKDVFITAAVRCAPPQNKPRPDEIRRCLPFVRQEIAAMPRLKVVIALGKIAHDAYLKIVGEPLSKYPFSHGAVHHMGDHPVLADVYHPSRQNTQTGRLTMEMFLSGLKKAAQAGQILL